MEGGRQSAGDLRGLGGLRFRWGILFYELAKLGSVVFHARVASWTSQKIEELGCQNQFLWNSVSQRLTGPRFGIPLQGCEYGRESLMLKWTPYQKVGRPNTK